MPGVVSLLSQRIKPVSLQGKYAVLVVGADGAPVRYKVVDIAGYNGGYAMRYLDGEKLEDVVYVPLKYKFKEDDGVKLVGKRLGNNSACPIMILGESIDKDCPGEDLSAVGRSDLYARAIMTLWGKQNINWKMILVIGAIAVVVIFVVYKFAR